VADLSRAVAGVAGLGLRPIIEAPGFRLMLGSAVRQPRVLQYAELDASLFVVDALDTVLIVMVL
jgi:hypothetical protein